MHPLEPDVRQRQHYGSKWSTLHPEAYRMWLSAHKEPEVTPKFGMRALLVLDDDDDKAPVLAAQIWRIGSAVLRWREREVMTLRFAQDLTRVEIGQILNISPNRVMQIENKALRKIRVALMRPNAKVQAASEGGTP